VFWSQSNEQIFPKEVTNWNHTLTGCIELSHAVTCAMKLVCKQATTLS